jgi:putrescine transport system permease protein
MTRRTGLLPLRAVIVLPALWLAMMFLLPMLNVLRLSVSEPASNRPPYTPVFVWSDGPAQWIEVFRQFKLDNYATALRDALYVDALLTSVMLAGAATLVLLVISYPFALAISRASQRVKPVLLALVILPFWTSFLIRVYAWIAILKPEGYANSLLLWLGWIDQPLQLINTNGAVILGIVYAYLPFMVLPLWASLERLDGNLVEAAQDLGTPPRTIFWVIIVPLTWPGALAGCLMVFIPALGEVIIPDLLGGTDTLMIGKLIWSEFFSNRDWPLACAIAVILLCILGAPIMAWQWLERHAQLRA